MNATLTDRERAPADDGWAHDLEAEMSLLGSMLFSGDCIPAVKAILADDGDRFYLPNHETLYVVLLDLYNQAKPIDLVILRDELTRRGIFEKIGGTPFLVGLVESVPHAANAEYYAKIVRDKADLRGLKVACADTVRAVEGGGVSAVELLRDALTRLEALATDSLPDGPGPGWATLQEIGSLPAYKSGIPCVTTGYGVLDAALGGGLRPESTYILAGRTGTAKSTLALNIARRVALAGDPLLVFALEEGVRLATYRIHAAAAQVRLKTLLDGAEHAEPDVQERLADGWGLVHDLPIGLADARDISALERITERHAKRGGKIVIIDQLSKVSVPDTAIGFEQATIVSERLRLLAKRVSLPTLVICQVNRPAARSEGHLSCHDLRDSGQIENDATAVILVDKVRAADGPTYGGPPACYYLQLVLGKNRYGPCTDPEKPIELEWHPQTCRVEDATMEGPQT